MEKYLRWLGNRVTARLNELREKHVMLDELPHDERHLDELGRPYLPRDKVLYIYKQYEVLVLDQGFWDAAHSQFAGEASPLAQSIMLRGALEAERLLPLINFDLANQTVYQLSGRYMNDWWGALERTTRNQLRDAIQAHISTGAPHKSLIQTLSPLFGRQRAEVIATTEVTRMFAMGNQIGYRTAGIQTVEWRTAFDERVCPLCGPRNGERHLIDTSEIPPAHPRCRCWISPVVDGRAVEPWRVAASDAEVNEMLASMDYFESNAFTTAEVATLNRYRDAAGYRPINEALRRGNVTSQAQTIDSAIAKSRIGENIVVYRGVSREGAEYLRANAQVGSIVSDRAFLSTTLDRRTAQWHASGGVQGPTGEAGVLMEIRIPRGANGLALDRTFQFDVSNAEVLLARGSRFRVDIIEPGKMVMTLVG